MHSIARPTGVTRGPRGSAVGNRFKKGKSRKTRLLPF